MGLVEAADEAALERTVVEAALARTVVEVAVLLLVRGSDAGVVWFADSLLPSAVSCAREVLEASSGCFF
jgi:hypothetical protein